jgi:hypothetical protein
MFYNRKLYVIFGLLLFAFCLNFLFLAAEDGSVIQESYHETDQIIQKQEEPQGVNKEESQVIDQKDSQESYQEFSEDESVGDFQPEQPSLKKLNLPFFGEFTIKTTVDPETWEETRVARPSSGQSYNLVVLEIKNPEFILSGPQGQQFKADVKVFGQKIGKISLEELNIFEKRILLKFLLKTPINISITPWKKIKIDSLYASITPKEKRVFVKLPSLENAELSFNSIKNNLGVKKSYIEIKSKQFSLSTFMPKELLKGILGGNQDLFTVKNPVIRFYKGSGEFEIMGGVALMGINADLLITNKQVKNANQIQEEKQKNAKNQKKDSKKKKKKERQKKVGSKKKDISVTIVSKKPYKPFESIPGVNKIPRLSEVELRELAFTFGSDKKITVSGLMQLFGNEVEASLIKNKQATVVEAFLGSSWQASNFFKELEGTFVDVISVSDPVVLFSSGKYFDKQLNTNVSKGLSLVGTIKKDDKNLGVIASLFKAIPDELIVSGTIGSSPMDLALSIAIPIDMPLWPNRIIMRNVALEFSAADLGLELFAQVEVRPSQKDNPLFFTVSGTIQPDELFFSGTMEGEWKDPLGIAGFTIADVAAEIGFVPPGAPIPTLFGITGKLDIGGVIAEMATKITPNLSEVILQAYIPKLGFQEIATMINTLGNIDIPTKSIPDVLSIQDVDILIAPKGGQIGEIEFEQGLTCNGKLNLLGATAEVQAKVDPLEGVVAQGTLSEINLGPLIITGKGLDKKHGTDNDGPVVSIELSSSKQEIFISGRTEFLGAGQEIEIEVSPTQYKFFLSGNLLGFETEIEAFAKLSSDPKFMVKGKMKNDFIKFLRKEILERLKDLRSQDLVDIQNYGKFVPKFGWHKLFTINERHQNKYIKNVVLDREYIFEKDKYPLYVGWFSDAFRSVGHAFSSAASSVSTAFTSIADEVKEAVEDAAKEVEKVSEKVVNEVSNFAEKTANEVAEVAQIVGEKTINVAEGIGEGVVEVGEKIGEGDVGGAFETLGETALNAAKGTINVGFAAITGVASVALGSMLDMYGLAFSIKNIEFEASLDELKTGSLGKASLSLEILGEGIHLKDIDLELKRPDEFVAAIFNAIVKSLG